jgi:hypothetical protein
MDVSIAGLAKLAAAYSHGRRRGNNSRLYKVDRKGQNELPSALYQSTDNSQSPHRYGRKKRKKLS